MKIAVIGAGISGLAFAAAMQRYSPQTRVEVYERDQSPTSRLQGYSLGLKGDTGLAVLKTLGLYEQIADEVATITNFVFFSQRGQRLLELPATGNEKLLTQRVWRQTLKKVLLQAVGPTPVHFGRRCTGYRQSAEGIEALFEDGTSAQADYLIACDGASSALRQQLSGDQKHYLGLTSIICQAPSSIQHPLLQGGYFMTLGDDGSSLFCYRQSDSIPLAYTVHVPSEDDLNAQAPTELLRRVQHATSTWHAPIPELVTAIDINSVVVRGYYDKEPLTRVREGRLWMIGDAAHPMTPSQGQGANMGMVDSLKLAQYITDLETSHSQSETEAKAEVLETDIISRGRKAVLESRAASRRLHETDRLQQHWRNAGFRVGNTFIHLFSREASQSN